MTVKDLIELSKKEIDQDTVYQDREFFQQEGTNFNEWFKEQRWKVDLGKLVTNFDKILENDPDNSTKRRYLLRYFVVLINARKYRLNYRINRLELLGLFKDLNGYI